MRRIPYRVVFSTLALAACLLKQAVASAGPTLREIMKFAHDRKLLVEGAAAQRVREELVQALGNSSYPFAHEAAAEIARHPRNYTIVKGLWPMRRIASFIRGGPSGFTAAFLHRPSGRVFLSAREDIATRAALAVHEVSHQLHGVGELTAYRHQVNMEMSLADAAGTAYPERAHNVRDLVRKGFWFDEAVTVDIALDRIYSGKAIFITAEELEVARALQASSFLDKVQTHFGASSDELAELQLVLNEALGNGTSGGAVQPAVRRPQGIGRLAGSRTWRFAKGAGVFAALAIPAVVTDFAVTWGLSQVLPQGLQWMAPVGGYIAGAAVSTAIGWALGMSAAALVTMNVVGLVVTAVMMAVGAAFHWYYSKILEDAGPGYELTEFEQSYWQQVRWQYGF